MGFLDTLTSDTAQQDAREIKSKLVDTNLDNLNSFFTLVSDNLELLTYNRLASITISRNSYEMNRMVRKRNSLYKAIREINDKYEACLEFFSAFAATDPELIARVNDIQSVVLSLNSVYQFRKYETKENVSVQQSIGITNGDVVELKSLIDDFNEFFTA